MNKHTLPHGGGLMFQDELVYRGYNAPVRIEGHVHDLEVMGTIPPELEGVYVRNSADPTYPSLHGGDIFINGDGMVHMVRLQNGHADLTTRYVRTRKFELEREARQALFGKYRNPYTDDPRVQGEDNNTANTSILWHHKKMYAIKESGRPYEIDPVDLSTKGESDFGGQLKSKTFTAHPKIDPLTGHCIAFSYNCEGVASDEVEVYEIAPDGEFISTERFKAPYSSMIHDCMVSRNYIIFVICPMTCDWEMVKKGESYWHWDSHLETTIGVIPRDGGVAKMKWFKAPKQAFQTHTFNAWEDGSKLHLDHFVQDSGWLSQFPDIRNPEAQEKPPFGERWTLDLATEDGDLRVDRFIPHIGEMPVIDGRFSMSRTRHYWFGTNHPAKYPMLEWGPKGPPFTCLGHHDDKTGKLELWYSGPDSSPEEPCFVPRSADADEGDGWLLSVVGRRAENRTDLVILEARNITAGPVAIIKMPSRIHEGFHGIWVPGDALGSDKGF